MESPNTTSTSAALQRGPRLVATGMLRVANVVACADIRHCSFHAATRRRPPPTVAARARRQPCCNIAETINTGSINAGNRHLSRAIVDKARGRRAVDKHLFGSWVSGEGGVARNSPLRQARRPVVQRVFPRAKPEIPGRVAHTWRRWATAMSLCASSKADAASCSTSVPLTANLASSDAADMPHARSRRSHAPYCGRRATSCDPGMCWTGLLMFIAADSHFVVAADLGDERVDFLCSELRARRRPRRLASVVAMRTRNILAVPATRTSTPRALSRFARASASAFEPYAATCSVYRAFDTRGTGVVPRWAVAAAVLSRRVLSREEAPLQPPACCDIHERGRSSPAGCAARPPSPAILQRAPKGHTRCCGSFWSNARRRA